MEREAITVLNEMIYTARLETLNKYAELGIIDAKAAETIRMSMVRDLQMPIHTSHNATAHSLK